MLTTTLNYASLFFSLIVLVCTIPSQYFLCDGTFLTHVLQAVSECLSCHYAAISCKFNSSDTLFVDSFLENNNNFF